MKLTGRLHTGNDGCPYKGNPCPPPKNDTLDIVANRFCIPYVVVKNLKGCGKKWIVVERLKGCEKMEEVTLNDVLLQCEIISSKAAELIDEEAELRAMIETMKEEGQWPEGIIQ